MYLDERTGSSNGNVIIFKFSEHKHNVVFRNTERLQEEISYERNEGCWWERLEMLNYSKCK